MNRGTFAEQKLEAAKHFHARGMQCLPCFRKASVLVCERRKRCRATLTYYSNNYTGAGNNPLRRLEDLGTRSFGIILEFEAVILPTTLNIERDVWNQLACEENLKRPLDYQIQCAFRRKPEYVISQVFNWTNDATRIRLLTSRKCQIYLQKTFLSTSCIETNLFFLSQLKKSNIRYAIYSSQLSSEELARALKELNLCVLLEGDFRDGQESSYIFGRDSFTYGLPDTELYLLMAQVLGQLPIKCIVFSDNHLAIEAACELGMKSVILTKTARSWELSNADIVVPSLQGLSFRNLQNLFTLDVYD